MSVSRLHVCLTCTLLATGYSLAALANEDASWQHDPYTLGQGLSFPQQGLVVGGYINLHYADLENQDWGFDARDISLFVSKTFAERWQIFSEIEIGDALRLSSQGAKGDQSELDLERLYADYQATRAINFRFGKFLTPVGRWNLIHADPLVWTADRPLTTAAPFARHASGAMLYGDIATGENSLDYSIYVDDSGVLDPSQKNELAFEDDASGASPHNAFKNAAGARVAYHFLEDTAQIGISYLRYEMYGMDEKKELFGADALVTVKRIEFSGEWIYRYSLGAEEKNEHGGYVQAVLPLSDRFYLVGRHEKYSAAFLPSTATIDSIGITFRLNQAISLKLEYRDGSHNEILAPSGWLSSFAILF